MTTPLFAPNVSDVLQPVEGLEGVLEMCGRNCLWDPKGRPFLPPELALLDLDPGQSLLVIFCEPVFALIRSIVFHSHQCSRCSVQVRTQGDWVNLYQQSRQLVIMT